MAPKQNVYMDGLNYSREFFTDDWDLSVAYDNLKNFVDAAKRSNIALKVFIDATTDSDEALIKWRSRREKELRDGDRGVPQGLSTLLGDMFKSQGVPVLYSTEVDCDDALAFHAHHDGADVLSRDKDFWRYVGARYTIYFDFTLNNGRLLLNKSKRPAQWKMPSPRPLGPPPPVSTTENSLCELNSLKMYRRGAPSPLIRLLGFNPHVTALPLRLALYSELLFGEGCETDNVTLPSITITEEFPVWNSAVQCPDWSLEKVTVKNPKFAKPNEDEQLYAKLLNQPEKAFKYFFPKEHQHLPTLDGFASWDQDLPKGVTSMNWHKHCSACRAVIYELCCLSTGKILLNALVPSLA